MQQNKVYILLLNWNGWRNTVECLESVFRSDYPNYQVIVCDNDSHDGSLEHIKAWAYGHMDSYVDEGNPLRHLSFPPISKPIVYAEYDQQQIESGESPAFSDERLILIQTGANLGYAGGNNVGLRYILSKANFSYVWLLNNDTVIDAKALTELVFRAEADQRIGICGSSLLYYHTPNRYQALGGATYNKWLGVIRCVGVGMQVGKEISGTQVEMAMDFVVGASTLVSFDFLQTVGLMEESYFLYYEELDWAAKSNGRFLLAYAPNSIVYHKEGASIGTKNSADWDKRFRATYYFIRSKLIFTRKYYPYALPTVYFGIMLTIIIRLLSGQWRRAMLIVKVLLKLASKAG